VKDDWVDEELDELDEVPMGDDPRLFEVEDEPVAEAPASSEPVSITYVRGPGGSLIPYSS
jgi:hypothetical protein